MLTKVDRFEHGAVAEKTSPHVIDFAVTRPLKKAMERLNEICTMDIISHLFSFVAEHFLRSTRGSTPHQVRQEAMKLRTRMTWAGQTSATKASGMDCEIAAILLNQQIRRGL